MRREAAEASARHSAFLARASEALGRAPDRDAFIGVLAQLPVPDLADAGLVWFRGEGQAGHSEPGRIEWFDADGGMIPSPAVLDRLEPHVAYAMAEGRPVLFADRIARDDSGGHGLCADVLLR